MTLTGCGSGRVLAVHALRHSGEVMDFRSEIHHDDSTAAVGKTERRRKRIASSSTVAGMAGSSTLWIENTTTGRVAFVVFDYATILEDAR